MPQHHAAWSLTALLESWKVVADSFQRTECWFVKPNEKVALRCLSFRRVHPGASLKVRFERGWRCQEGGRLKELVKGEGA
jgi:hypothetical protein